MENKKLEKQVKNKNGKNYYLLGVKDNEKYWLCEGSFDCGWYWGVGYVQVFNRNYTDIVYHTHFDSLFFNKRQFSGDVFRQYFDEITLSDSEVYKLMELMKTIYTLREYSDTLHRGGAHITSNPVSDLIKNDEEYNRINKVLIPALLNEVYKLLGGVE